MRSFPLFAKGNLPETNLLLLIFMCYSQDVGLLQSTGLQDDLRRAHRRHATRKFHVRFRNIDIFEGLSIFAVSRCHTTGLGTGSRRRHLV